QVAKSVPPQSGQELSDGTRNQPIENSVVEPQALGEQNNCELLDLDSLNWNYDEHVNDENSFFKNDDNLSLHQSNKEKRKRHGSTKLTNRFRTQSLSCTEADCDSTFGSKSQLDHHLTADHSFLPNRCLMSNCNASFS